MPNPPKPCPFCDSPPSTAFAPFCSKGCRDRDMLQWLGDGYRIPGPPADEATDSLGLDRDDIASL